MSNDVAPPFRAAAWRQFLPRGKTLPEHVWRMRHRGILALLWAHVVGIPLYGIARGFSGFHSIFETGLVAVAAVAASVPSLSRRARTLAASLGLLISSSVLVHLSHGLIEMHFHFFVMITVVALYQDWLPFLASIAYVVFHHGVIGTIDPHSVYNHPSAWANPWMWAGIHAGFICAISTVCLVTWSLNERVLAQQRLTEGRLREETGVVEALHAVGQTLLSELTFQPIIQSVLDAVTRLTGVEFGAFLYSVGIPGELQHVLSSGQDPATPTPSSASEVEALVSAGGVLRVGDVAADARYAMLPYVGEKTRSYMTVPVEGRSGGTIGRLYLTDRKPGAFTDIHERIVQGIAAQTSVALENARLHESERVSHAVSESARHRLALLADVSTVLGETLEMEDLLNRVAVQIAPRFVDFCAIDVLNDDDRLDRVACVTDPAFSGVTAAMEHDPPSLDNAGHPGVRALRSGVAQVVSSVTPDCLETTFPDETVRAVVTRHEPTAMVCVPLPGRRGVLGTLTVAMFAGSRRSFGSEEVRLMEEVARRISVAMENARLYARQRSVSMTLQHSLLPERLPDLPGLEATARYVPGGPGVEIGGDWYDVFRLPRGQIALAMGDVVGHGERAASLMGQLRNGARAYAIKGMSPAQIAESLNVLLMTLGPDCMATMIYAILDPDTGTVRFVNAGHPPPVVVDTSQAVSFLECESGAPLGAAPRSKYVESVASLQEGATLVLYTDGLIEVRTESIDDGLNRLLSAVAEAPSKIEELGDYVLRAMLKGKQAPDDVALLAVRLLPAGPHLRLTIPRDPALVAHLRATLRRWLAVGGAGDEEISEIILATTEACANAVQHATGAAAIDYEIEGFIGEEVTISIRDKGSWRPQRRTDGGRGLAIMRRFMDSVDVQSDASGSRVVMKRQLHAQQKVVLP